MHFSGNHHQYPASSSDSFGPNSTLLNSTQKVLCLNHNNIYIAVNQVKATATVTAVEGRKVKFIVEAKDDKELVGKGEHERFILNKQRFLEKAEKKVKSE